MADPSGNKPSFHQKGSGSGSSSEEHSRERTVIPGSSDHGDGAPSPPRAPPAAQPPVAQAGQSGGRPTKKKAKMGKEAAAGMKVVVVEDPGKKKKKFASLENLPGRARTCSICRREFPTARALFGHMRSHPERRWRGAHPPPVSPRREVEEECLDAEQTGQAHELTRSLLNIGQRILSTGKFKAKEGFQAAGGIGAGIEKGTTTVGEASGVVSGRLSGSSSGDSGKKKKKKKKRVKKKKTTMGKALDYTDEDQRKRIHSQIDLNKEATAEDDDEEEEEETPSASSN